MFRCFRHDDEHRVDHRGDVGHRRGAGAHVPVARHRDHQRVATGAPRPRDGAVRPHRHGLVGRGRRARHRAPRRPSTASAPCSSTTRSTSGAAAPYMGEGDPANNRDEIIANTVRRSCSATCSSAPRSPRSTPGSTVGLVQISSASARIAYPGLAIYGASKAAMEQWVGAVRGRARGPRQGPVGVGHPSRLRRHARGDATRGRAPRGHVPGRRRHRRGRAHRQLPRPPRSAAENIWNSIPADCIAKPVLLFGEAVGVTT